MLTITLILSVFLYLSMIQNQLIAYQLPCELRKYSDGYVCVCNETYCDTLNVEKPKNFGDYIVVSSSNSERFVVESKNDIKQQFDLGSKPNAIDLTINQEQKYQKIVGFGGAFTGSVSFIVDQMSEELRRKFYESYYSYENGIGYTMMRIPIGGCDFDLAPWAYNEQPANDLKLSNFSQLNDKDLHRIKQINELKDQTQNQNIKFIGSAWSPPIWMKTNNKWSGASALKTEFYQTWADYHVKWLELMDRENMHFYGITSGNEPLNGVIGWFFIHFMSLGIPYSNIR